MTPADHANTLRDALTEHVPDGYDQVDPGHEGPLRREALAALDALQAQAETAEETRRRVPSDEGGPGKEETYWLRLKMDAAIAHLRDVEDYYRVREGESGSINQIRADRARWIYERITDDFLRGRTSTPSIGELEAERDAAVQAAEQARNALREIAHPLLAKPGTYRDIALAALAGNQP